MKTIKELSISPAPWGFGRPSKTHDAWIYCDDRPRGGAKKCNMFFVHYPYVGMMDEKCVRREQTANARFIAAMPELYDAVQRYIEADDEMEHSATVSDDLILRRKTAFRDMRIALAKAAGEGGVK